MWKKQVFRGIWTFFLATALLSAEEKWIKVTSPNFELYTTASEGTARSAVHYFEQVRGFFVNAIGIEPKAGKRIRLVGFRSGDEFQKYIEFGWAAAFYQSSADHDYIVMKSLTNKIDTVAVHEYVHALVRHAGVKLPAWLSEGLAEFYSTIEPVGKKVRVGNYPSGRYQLLMQNKWLPMEHLIGVSRQSAYHDERDRISMFYSQSWALTHMVLMGDGYQEKGKEFIRRLQSQPGLEAFRAVFGKSMQELTDDLNSYMRNLSYKVLLFDVPLEKMAENPEVQPLMISEGNLILARLLLNRKNYAEARALLKDVNEESAGAEQSEILGYLHLYAHEDAKAVEYFLRASAAGSTTARMYVDLAGLLGEAKRHGEAIAALRAGLKIDASDTNTRVWLANMLIDQKRYGEAVRELSQASALDPERASQYYFMLARAYIGLKAWKQARSAANFSAKHASADMDKNVAGRLIEYLDRREEFEKSSTAGGAPAEPPSVPFPVVRRLRVREAEGTFEKLDCSESGKHLHFIIEGKPLVLALDNPKRVRTTSPKGLVDLTCGPQNSFRVKIGWIVEDAPEGTSGLLRKLDFAK